MMRSLEVLATGPLATVQDLGRPGLAALGVGRSGAADPEALRLGNRLLGNPEGAAGIEVTFGGLEIRAHGPAYLAVTGAAGPVTVNGRPGYSHTVITVHNGDIVNIGRPDAGLRSYLTVRGGLAMPPVLGARSTDVLSGIGPAVLAAGSQVPVGDVPEQALPGVGEVPPLSGPDDVELAVVRGPRDDWFTAAAWQALTSEPFEVSTESNRVGMRLTGPELKRVRDDELPSEGMIAGALQVPPSGHPTLFLADHPVTGGYPVIGVVASSGLGEAAQVRPGQRLRFRETARPEL